MQWLVVDEKGMVAGYTLRQQDGKRKAAEALRSLNYHVIGMGDSYNDLSMLMAAHQGILFRPPDSIRSEYPDLPVATTYPELRGLLAPLLNGRPEG